MFAPFVMEFQPLPEINVPFFPLSFTAFLCFAQYIKRRCSTLQSAVFFFAV
jgi:hypothetical protein